MTLVIILVAVGCLAFANGANDNFKGVATLFGSGTTNYRRALWWATATTMLGSVTAVALANQLLKSFRGKGLVAEELTTSLAYGAAVALAAGLTVLLATRIGMPISTTHGLVGALVGAGLAAGSSIDLVRLGRGFFLPLLISPLLAILLTAVVYPLFRMLRRRTGIEAETCFCVEDRTLEVAPQLSQTAALERLDAWSVQVGDQVTCRSQYSGRVLGLEAGVVLDRAHYLSAGLVSYARGLNDTPKIAALLLLTPQMTNFGAAALVGVMIALGGLIAARKVGETMSQKITDMNHGQGFTANLITGLVVIGASRLGVPVSTTHVSCGSLFGIGWTTGQGHGAMIGKILGAWLITLPTGAGLGYACYWGLSRLS